MRVPDYDLPPEISGPAAWYGPDQAARTDWIIRFSAADIAEIEAATQLFLTTGAEIGQMSRSDFPLPGLSPKLATVLAEVLNGRGFALFRGLPVERWSIAEAAAAFFGIGTHLGSARSQNGKGHVLGHVRDLGLASNDPNVRIYQTRERQTFHTDSCDVVALLCLKTAKSGGDSALVSSVTLYNEMRRRRPDLARLLFQPLATDRRGEVGAGEKPYYEIPVFSWHENLLSAIYQRQYIDSSQRFPDAPRQSPALVEALDLFDALADDPALNFTMRLEPGDVQLVHNHTLLHDRTGFEDWPEPEKKRHLLRLWLSPEASRPLPACFAQRFGTTIPGARGGIILPQTHLNAPLAAV
ncbi:MAG: TauD/TfdA family dioxygenase [Alphaproteobacteria bacterium]|nr:TauD/TfdA family dioxygenase [Alphaproteobacteria bacterium]MBU0798200.1 TauD/TfdA family dioxygenase [Alphaproteobacteria bacterium]MBU0887582.1 TauD/TfdA family dioxygenase [Alphaproteobacteria bacterium]MBU1814233.1 TauD/TfdA family dioxygenase [Alphaproteobacteria bacterium]